MISILFLRLLIIVSFYEHSLRINTMSSVNFADIFGSERSWM